jgi:hypothetical protein
LNAGQSEQQKRGNGNGESGDSRNAPGKRPELNDKDRQNDNNQSERSKIQFQKSLRATCIPPNAAARLPTENGRASRTAQAIAGLLN